MAQPSTLAHPDLVPLPRGPARARDWFGWRVFGIVVGALLLCLLSLVVLSVCSPAYSHCDCHTTGVATLRGIASAEAQFLAAGAVDIDGDGVPEYGSFRELSGAARLRGRTTHLDPAVLSGVYRTPDATGAVSRATYRFRLYVRSSAGSWVCPGTDPDAVDADAAERGFLCYAWPVTQCRAQHRATYVIDEAGTMLARPSHDGRADRDDHSRAVEVRPARGEHGARSGQPPERGQSVAGKAPRRSRRRGVAE